MSTSAMRQGSSGKGDGFRGSISEYRSGYNNIDWGTYKCDKCGALLSNKTSKCKCIEKKV